ncbi:Bug family tripartite tricarboxylate transporter substrate binding protein [Bordetella petrii]|uniref:Bug family tripartite tricarboxylate transporter substrate binding protein n=1 Tax=Bordetella petrii TaxID=94624 RepID=UPI001E2BD9A1|nr:tripartite tricarboxylate transporter substrate binding protein [Bordetella petrii]MCD0504960.1 tripartite tricarboxylate transporter substrate binding protein [Bordetella petrii]
MNVQLAPRGALPTSRPQDVHRRRLMAALAALAAGAAMPRLAGAETAFPQRQLTLMVPFAPGGPVDIAARAVAEPMARRLAQSIVVVNKGGAGGNIGADEVARSQPDGHTLLLALDSILTVNPSFYGQAAPPPALLPVGMLGELSSVLVVNAKSPIKSVADFVDYGTRQGMTAGSGGSATAGHLYAEWLKRDYGVNLTPVPYKGLSPAVQDLLAGNIDCIVALIPGVLPHIRSGALRALGLTSIRPQILLPEVLPLSEQGLPGFTGASWLALMVPQGVPEDARRRLAADLQSVLDDAGVVSRLQAVGIDPFYADAAQVQERITRERNQWATLLQAMQRAPQS